MPWAEDAEVASIGITWPENFYFASKLKQGQFPLWDPYTGGGVPTLDRVFRASRDGGSSCRVEVGAHKFWYAGWAFS